jgi:glycosyltransferase involved in cell wall biosynthesis
MNILIFAGLSDKKLLSKLLPIISSNKVEKIFLVRDSPLLYHKVQSLSVPVCFRFIIIKEILKIIFGCYICSIKKVDYVVGSYLKPHGIIAYLMGRIFGKPVIQLFLGNDIDLIEKHPQWFQGLLRQAKFIGVRGSRSEKRLGRIADLGSKFFVLHNVYDVPRFAQAENIEEKTTDIICVADFTRVKRIDVFLRIVDKVKEKRPDIKAVMVGSGGRRKYYEKLKGKMGLDDTVRFAGRVSDIFPELKKSKIFLLTSETEGLPMSMIEAMSLGIPCVVPDVGDVTDIVKDGVNALIVKPLDVDVFVSRVLMLLENEDLYDRISKEAINSIREVEINFSLPQIQLNWDNILT